MESILREPENDDLRLIFADWLKDNEEPYFGRYLELAVKHNLNRRTKNLPYELQSIVTYHWNDDWLGMGTKTLLQNLWPEFRFAGIRGFVGWCSCYSYKGWERMGTTIVSRVPLIELDILDFDWAIYQENFKSPVWKINRNLLPEPIRKIKFGIHFSSEQSAKKFIGRELLRVTRKEAFG